MSLKDKSASDTVVTTHDKKWGNTEPWGDEHPPLVLRTRVETIEEEAVPFHPKGKMSVGQLVDKHIEMLTERHIITARASRGIGRRGVFLPRELCIDLTTLFGDGYG